MPGALYDGEMLELLLGVGTVVFILAYRRRLEDMPDYRLLRLAFVAVFVSWVATVAEAFALPNLLNIVEHVFYTAGTLGLCAWVVRRLREGDLCNTS
jgi:hypothetical protein